MPMYMPIYVYVHIRGGRRGRRGWDEGYHITSGYSITIKYCIIIDTVVFDIVKLMIL